MSESCKSTSCEDIEVLISCSLDDELSFDEQAMLTDHLAVCSSCRARQSNFEEVNRLVRQQVREVDTSDFSICLPPRKSAKLNKTDSATRRTIAYTTLAASSVIVFLLLSFSFSFSDKSDMEEILAPLVMLTEINSQRIEDQRFFRDSLALDLRTLKLQLASLESEDASAALSDRIDGLMRKLADFEVASAEN